MNPIRPANLPLTPAPAQRPGGADAARAAAQKAFFDAAMGRAPPAAQTAVTPAATAPAAPQRVEQRSGGVAENPTRILRPGSLLDIRV